MALHIGDLAPDFEAETTEGRIRFHEWLGNSWGVVFSHPKDFTPVCTTELGYMARLKPEFDKRHVTVIGLSMDDIEHNLIIGDPEQVIEGMLMRKQLGFDGVLMDMSYHLPEHEAVVRSLRLMRDEVMPALSE